MIDKSNIAILTTVANFNLYRKTSTSFPTGIRKYIIDGSNGMYGLDSIKYMMKKLKGRGIEWLIMADEDVIFVNPEITFKIVEHMRLNDYCIAGVRDGGVVKHRNQNPFVINTFFSILNFKEIEKIWNKDDVLKNQYVLNQEFSDELNKLKFDFDRMSLYEPYYCFYFWLRRFGKKFLFLESIMESDSLSNRIEFNNQILLSHTWYARSYENNTKHTKRINKIIDLYSFKNNFNKSKPKIFKDYTFLINKRLNNYLRSLKNIF